MACIRAQQMAVMSSYKQWGSMTSLTRVPRLWRHAPQPHDPPLVPCGERPPGVPHPAGTHGAPCVTTAICWHVRCHRHHFLLPVNGTLASGVSCQKRGQGAGLCMGTGCLLEQSLVGST